MVNKMENNNEKELRAIHFKIRDLFKQNQDSAENIAKGYAMDVVLHTDKDKESNTERAKIRAHEAQVWESAMSIVTKVFNGEIPYEDGKIK